MGSSKRRKRTEREALQEHRRTSGRKGRRAENDDTKIGPASYEAGLPDGLGIDRRFWKFALAFLIIFVLLWLLAPEHE